MAQLPTPGVIVHNHGGVVINMSFNVNHVFGIAKVGRWVWYWLVCVTGSLLFAGTDSNFAVEVLHETLPAELTE